MNKTKHFLLTLLILSSVNIIWAQNKIVDSSFDTWWSNTNKYNLNQSWYLSSELHLRRADGINDLQQFVFRPALNYKKNTNVIFTLGYTYIQSHPYGEQPIAIVTPENNIWEQITLKQNLSKLNISHRYRFEQRFIGKPIYNSSNEPSIDGTMYAQRFRYRLTLSKSISKKEKLFAKTFNELWINIDDKNIMPTSLNQNWLYAGLGYKLSPKVTIQLGYMNRIIKKGDGIHYENNQTIQFTIGFEFL